MAKDVAEGATDAEWLVTEEDLARKELPTAEERTADDLKKVHAPLLPDVQRKQTQRRVCVCFMRVCFMRVYLSVVFSYSARTIRLGETFFQCLWYHRLISILKFATGLCYPISPDHVTLLWQNSN